MVVVAVCDESGTGATIGRMDRPNRLRIALVGFLTLGVMVGVVAAARHAKTNGTIDGPSPDAAFGMGPKGVGTPPVALPPECRPSQENPGTLRFELPADVLDLGSVKQGSVIERDVVVRNTGSGILCIPERPRTGCGCVQAEWVGEMRIPPTGSGIARLRVDTKGKEGHVDKDVTVVSNDPIRPQAVFRVKFEVKLGVLVAKSASVTAGSVVYFGRHAPGRPATAVVRLKTPREDAAWNVTAVEGTKTKFTFRTAPAEPNDTVFRHVDVTIEHPGSEQLDLNDETLKILTTHPDRPEILLHAQLLVSKKFYTSPPSVRFGFVGGSSNAVASPRMVTVFPGEEGTPFRVKKAVIEGRGFTVGLPTDHGNDGWQVEVRYDEQKRSKGPVEAKLIFHIDETAASSVSTPSTASTSTASTSTDTPAPGASILEVRLHAEVRD